MSETEKNGGEEHREDGGSGIDETHVLHEPFEPSPFDTDEFDPWKPDFGYYLNKMIYAYENNGHLSPYLLDSLSDMLELLRTIGDDLPKYEAHRTQIEAIYRCENKIREMYETCRPKKRHFFLPLGLSSKRLWRLSNMRSLLAKQILSILGEISEEDVQTLRLLPDELEIFRRIPDDIESLRSDAKKLLGAPEERPS